jgi:4,5-DOPA dioxygenase extradiol
MPVLFVGHGSPLYAIEDNQWSRGFRSLARLVPRPRAVVMVSAHWYTDGTLITSNERPQTIHDFYGFPPELHEVQYPAPGDPELALRLRDLIGQGRAELNNQWGLDHGAWSILRWMYPQGDVPVIQISIDRNLAVPEHFELAKSLRPLRDEMVLIMGSGNVTHNLRDLMFRMQTGDTAVPEWAHRFDERLKEILVARDDKALVELWPASDDARRSHQMPDHFLPIVYAYAVTDAHDSVRFPIEGFDHSASMRAMVFESALFQPRSGARV